MLTSDTQKCRLSHEFHSGAPLVCDDGFYGILSYTGYSTVDRCFSLWTLTYSYIRWINRVLEDNGDENVKLMAGQRFPSDFDELEEEYYSDMDDEVINVTGDDDIYLLTTEDIEYTTLTLATKRKLKTRATKKPKKKRIKKKILTTETAIEETTINEYDDGYQEKLFSNKRARNQFFKQSIRKFKDISRRETEQEETMEPSLLDEDEDDDEYYDLDTKRNNREATVKKEIKTEKISTVLIVTTVTPPVVRPRNYLNITSYNNKKFNLPPIMKEWQDFDNRHKLLQTGLPSQQRAMLISGLVLNRIDIFLFFTIVCLINLGY